MAVDRPPVKLHAVEQQPGIDAAEHLQYIRQVMERSASFTAVPGLGAVGAGLSALAAAYLAHLQPTATGWLLVWLAAATFAILFGGAMLVRKAAAEGMRLRSGPGRKYFLNLIPSLMAGALLTAVLWRAGQPELLPGVWLLLYGTATITGGLASVKVIPLMGAAFMVLGAAAFFLPPAYGNVLMAAGFGVLHLLFGIIIMVKYGG